MSASSLATLERLSVRLGVTFEAGDPDLERANEALWSASVQAKAVAQRSEWTSGTVPDAVVDVILAAAARIFKNPDRTVVSQAGTFGATLPQADFAGGSIFLAGELAVLHRHRPEPAVRVQSVYRDDSNELSSRYDPANYLPAPVDGVRGDPVYGWTGEFDR